MDLDGHKSFLKETLLIVYSFAIFYLNVMDQLSIFEENYQGKWIIYLRAKALNLCWQQLMRLKQDVAKISQ